MLKDQERFDLIAHFPSVEEARTAEATLKGRVEQQMGVTSGVASWTGLGVGMVFGAAIGLLLFRSLPANGLPPALMGQREILASALWAAILGSCGWIIGTSIRLFSSAPGTGRFELRVTVHAEDLAEIRRLLIAEGATMVRVNEAGISNVAGRASERRHTTGTFQSHTT